ncbi:MAG: hypothetical protein OEM18_07405 [Nitrosopumilus sp.]|nr:hypothetical protein [Nitrosopumilus sp.]MDH3502808.1 hypothetical protein [Nitrosopumilus sp.]
MTSKPETVLKQIRTLENKEHCNTFLEFYTWLTEDKDSTATNACTYLKILHMFSIDLDKKKLEEITQEDVVGFLDKRKRR